MILKSFTAGIYETNNYLLICEKTKEAVLIDAGGNFETTEKFLKENKANLTYILNTHGHWDHILGDYELQKAFSAKVMIHKDDEYYLNMLQAQLVLHGVKPVPPPKIYGFLEDAQEITIGEIKIKVIHTPGHTPGGVSLLVGENLFSGDTLFHESVGRTDFPGSSHTALENSVKNKLFKLEDNTVVYPGHGVSSTIGHEKQHNPYFAIK